MGNGHKYRVLVVDDDITGLTTLEAVLSGDFDVLTATSAERALTLLNADRFHVVCSDFKMPGMNGTELLRRVSALPYSVGCLLITGSDEYFHADLGSQHFVLRKPYNIERLMALVTQLAQLADMRRSTSVIPESGRISRIPSSEVPSSAIHARASEPVARLSRYR